MKVLQVFEPGVDGVFRHVEGLAWFLSERGVDVSLAYSDVRGSEGLRRLVADVAQRGGRTLNLAVGNRPSLKDIGAALALRRLIAELQPDVLHAHSSKAGGLLRLPLVARRALPVFYTPHAYYGMAGRSGVGPWMFDRIESLLARRGTTLNVSHDEAKFARARLGVPESRQRVIYNPVRTDVFRPATPEEKRAARQSFGVPEDATIVGTVGRMCFQKDPETLYRAMAPLLQARPDLMLMHLGDGELKGSLQSSCAAQKIERQVRFCGYTDQPLSFYHAIDALAMTSRYEGTWPTVTLEALACELPIVSSRAPGTADIDKHGLNHLWVAEVGDVAGFEAALKTLLDDLGRGRPSNHREFALRRLSPEACFGAVLREYRAAADRTPSAEVSAASAEVRAAPSSRDAASRVGRDETRAPARNLELD